MANLRGREQFKAAEEARKKGKLTTGKDMNEPYAQDLMKAANREQARGTNTYPELRNDPARPSAERAREARAGVKPMGKDEDPDAFARRKRDQMEKAKPGSQYYSKAETDEMAKNKEDDIVTARKKRQKAAAEKIVREK